MNWFTRAHHTSFVQYETKENGGRQLVCYIPSMGVVSKAYTPPRWLAIASNRHALLRQPEPFQITDEIGIIVRALDDYMSVRGRYQFFTKFMTERKQEMGSETSCYSCRWISGHRYVEGWVLVISRLERPQCIYLVWCPASP